MRFAVVTESMLLLLSDCLGVNGLLLFPSQHIVEWQGQQTELTKNEFLLIRVFNETGESICNARRTVRSSMG